MRYMLKNAAGDGGRRKEDWFTASSRSDSNFFQCYQERKCTIHPVAVAAFPCRVAGASAQLQKSLSERRGTLRHTAETSTKHAQTTYFNLKASLMHLHERGCMSLSQQCVKDSCSIMFVAHVLQRSLHHMCTSTCISSKFHTHKLRLSLGWMRTSDCRLIAPVP